MKGSKGKKKRSKQAFDLKRAWKKRKSEEANLLRKLAKYQLKDEARERSRRNFAGWKYFKIKNNE